MINNNKWPRPHENPGGWPPESEERTNGLLILEQPASLTPIDEVRVVKKGRNDPLMARESVVSDMEAGIDEDMAIQQQTVYGPLPGSGNDGETRATPTQLGGNSYAAVAVSMDNMNRGKSASCTYVEDEVVVLDEDVRVDSSSPIPSICFLNMVHNQVDHNMRNTIIVRLLGCSIGYATLCSHIQSLWKLVGEIKIIGDSATKDNVVVVDDTLEDDGEGSKDLYGPWMVVDKRRRRAVGRRAKSLGIYGPTSGSRFGVLSDTVENNNPSGGVVIRDMESEKLPILVSGNERPKAGEYRVTLKNTTYLLSNPDKKAKVLKKASNATKVILTIDGKDATVVPHNARISKGTHGAISIIEQGFEKVPNVGVRIGKSRVASSKGLKGTVRIGLGVRKRSNARLPLVDRSLNVDVGLHEVRPKSRPVTAHSSHVVHTSDREDSLYDARWDDMVEDEEYEGTSGSLSQ
ncbi:hypothetical protein V6N11_043166 [Hibiscus sabdariffa]|uniref:Uncharacterized protein n=1 Tax=Hibiscus sabdariffa TaxID=183260 RepID=A0ABR2QYK1_9ROSI